MAPTPEQAIDGNHTPSSFPWQHLLIIAACVAIVYSQALRFDFVTYDDYELVYQNEAFLSELSNIATSFTTHAFTTHRPESGYYRPLLLISYIFDYRIWRLAPMGYHLTNILLHLATTFILFFFLEKLVNNRVASLFGCLVFALHPMQTEAVAWVAGRNDVLLGFLVVSTMWCYAAYREKRRSLYLACSTAAFLLALFTKESAAFYILLLPLYDMSLRLMPMKAASSKKYLGELSLFAGAFILYMAARWNAIGELIGAEKLYGSTPFIERFQQMPSILFEHVRLLVVPTGLSIVHPVDRLPWPISAGLAIGLILVIGLAALLRYAWRLDKAIGFGLSWFGVGLLPALGIFPVAVPILEHRMYVPLAGLAVALARGISLGWEGVSRRQIISVATVAAITTFGTVSFLRLPVWQNSSTLWADAIEKAPTVSRSYFNLAGYYFDRQQYDSTIALLREYIKLRPDDFMGYSKLRTTYYLTGRVLDAGRISREIISHNPTNPARYLEAGMMYEQAHMFDSAAALFGEGLRVDSGYAPLRAHMSRTLFALATARAGVHESADAILLLEQGMNLASPSTEVVSLLARLYTETGQHEKLRLLLQRYRN